MQTTSRFSTWNSTPLSKLVHSYLLTFSYYWKLDSSNWTAISTLVVLVVGYFILQKSIVNDENIYQDSYTMYMCIHCIYSVTTVTVIQHSRQFLDIHLIRCPAYKAKFLHHLEQKLPCTVRKIPSFPLLWFSSELKKKNMVYL